MRSPGRSAAGRQRRARVDGGRCRSCRRTSRRRGRARRPWCRRRRSRRRPPRRPRRSPRPRRAARRRRGPPRGPATGVSASGRAPATARSLTVPLTASSPIEPPGKRIGLTTKLSVVSASSAPSTVTRAGVGQRVERRRAEGRHEQALDQRLRRLAAGAVGHRDLRVAELRRAWRARVSMIPRIRCSRSETVGARPSHHLPLAREAAVVVVGGAGALGRDHAGADRRARACRRCRTPCTPTA